MRARSRALYRFTNSLYSFASLVEDEFFVIAAQHVQALRIPKRSSSGSRILFDCGGTMHIIAVLLDYTVMPPMLAASDPVLVIP